MKRELKYFDCNFSPEAFKLMEFWNDTLTAYENKIAAALCRSMAAEVDQRIMKLEKGEK